MQNYTDIVVSIIIVTVS